MSHHHGTYLVGGAVRDRLLGLTPREHDWVVVGSTAETLLAQGYRQVGRDFPVFLHPHTQEEYALARTERKQGVGYHGFLCFADPSVSLEEDLLRRDLTINAMAMDEHDELIDPYGGQRDLTERVLRHVSPAFTEDPLRVLRVARFAARFHGLGFVIAPETMTLMQQISASGELRSLSIERLWQETERALATAHPAVFFQVLQQCHALAELWPALNELLATSTLALQRLHAATTISSTGPVRFAALTLGLTTEALAQQLHPPKRWLELQTLSTRYHAASHQANTLSAEQLLQQLEAVDAWRRPDRLDEFLCVCEADMRSQTTQPDLTYWQAEFWRAALNNSRIDVRNLASTGAKGPDIAAAIRTARLQNLETLRQQWSAS